MLVLAELTPLDPVTGSRVTLRVASAQDRSITGLNSVRWWPAMSDTPTLTQRLFDGDFSTSVDAGQASFALQLDGLAKLDANARRFTWAGAQVEIYAGTSGQAWPWTKYFSGKVDSFSAEANTLKLVAKIDTEPFEANAMTATYAGTGSAEGGADIKNKVKPWIFGRALNVEPVLINATDSVFQFSAYGPIEAVNVLYERGASFGVSIGDYANYAALVAATIPAGRWGTCLALGMIRLGAPPYGVITGDVDGDKPSGTWLRKTGEIINRIATNAGVSGGKIDSTSLAALDAAVARNVNIVLTEQKSVINLVRELGLPCNAQVGLSLTGKLFATRVAIGTPTITLDAQARRLPAVASATEEKVSPPYKRIEFGAARSWRVHTFDEIAFTAPLIDQGVYDNAKTYREGNIVSLANGSRYLFINTTPSAGHTPPNVTYWSAFDGATVVDFATGVTGATKPADNATADLTMYDPLAGTTYAFQGNKVSKNGTPGTWPNNAYSTQQVVGTAIVSGVLDTADTFLGFGPLTTTTPNGYAILPASVHRSGNGHWYIYEGGASVDLGTGFSASDIWTVTYDGANYRYYATSTGVTPLKVTPTTANQVLRAAVCIYSNGSSVSGIRFGAYTDNLWTSTVGSGRPEDYSTSADNMIVNGSVSVNSTGWAIGAGASHQLTGGAGDPSLGRFYFPASTANNIAIANDNTKRSINGAASLFVSGYSYMAGGGVSGAFRVDIDWYNAVGTYLATTSISAIQATLGAWLPFYGRVDAPAGAASFIASFQRANATGDVYATNLRVAKTEPNADVTMLVVAPATTVSLDYDYTGTIKASQDKVLNYKLIRGGSLDITTSATWAATTKSGSATYSIGSGTGILTVTAVTADAAIEVTGTYLGSSRNATLSVLRTIDAPPTGGGGGGGSGGTSASTGVISDTTASTYGSANTSDLTITIGTGGTATLAFTGNFYRATNGTGDAYGKWQRNISGTWTDVATETHADQTSSRNNGAGVNDPGNLTVVSTITGLTASSSQSFRLLLRNAGAYTHTWTGTASAVGS